jgi:hypothetical protein
MNMVVVLDRTHKIVKDYWHSSNISKGIKNIKRAWEKMPVKCLKGVWGKLL